MKKFVLIGDEDRAAFLRFCAAMRDMEENKDVFLSSARLSRHESTSKLDAGQQYGLQLALVWSKVVALLIVGIIVAVCLRG